jgi:hypothetical protein
MVCRNFASHLAQLREILNGKHRFWAFVSTDSAIFVWDFASAQARQFQQTIIFFILLETGGSLSVTECH